MNEQVVAADLSLEAELRHGLGSAVRSTCSSPCTAASCPADSGSVEVIPRRPAQPVLGLLVMGLHRMYAWILDRNRAGIAACAAVGAVREGVARQARFVDGQHSDLMLYGVLAEEYAVTADRARRRRPLLKRNTKVS
ncbi:GNAT family N-acetyltransferase [Nocardia sp. NPDC059195]|uniref:GNAT family N-acetyltransferase n=1 Tax=Nocardia sp. NPDC059195 TaxID=3346765 RepID=UPI003693960D